VIVEVVVSGGFKHGTSHYQQGEQAQFPDDVGARLVRAGWCRNVETGEVGELRPVRVSLDVHDSIQRMGTVV
jgi:hypothetical protein